VSEHPNATVYRKAFEALVSDDGSAGDFVADDVVWWQIGSAEPIRGKDKLMESMSMLEGIDFDLDLHDVTASDDHVVGLVTATVRAGDQEFTYRTAEIAHVTDGKISERWAFSDDTAAIIEFFAGMAAE
jgi:ketosteroid isomerase-like protein